MIIESIVLTNFKCFEEEHAFIFSPDSNLVKGENGKGKTTLVVDSIMFTLFGYAKNSLKDLMNKNKSSCKVEIKIKMNNSIYKITREFPTSIIIIKDGQEIDLPNNDEKQSYLNQIFKDSDFFKRFRMCDVKEGINILEEGKTALKKILLSINQDYFNNIRQKMLDKKKNREIYNQSAVVYKHYPSSKRLQTLNNNLGVINKSLTDLNNSLETSRKNISYQENQISNLTGKVGYLQSQADKLVDYDYCPTCKRQIKEEDKTDIINKFTSQIEEFNIQIEAIQKSVLPDKEQLQIAKPNIDKMLQTKDRIRTLINKLDTRLRQKDYKYTNRDVEIIKLAIVELDKFYSYYITTGIKNLEPIINDITNRIGFIVNFDLTAKGDLDIIINRNNKKYNYKDLSNGEKLIVSIALQIALLIQNQETGLIVADEGFGSLDEGNLKMVFELFKNLPFQLIAIVHRFNNVSDNINVINL